MGRGLFGWSLLVAFACGGDEGTDPDGGDAGADGDGDAAADGDADGDGDGDGDADADGDCAAPAGGGAFRSLAAAPAARQEHSVAVHDGEVWMVGGFLEEGNGDEVSIYDPARDAWRAGPTLPETRHHAPVVDVDGRLFVLGGMQSILFTLKAEVFELDPVGATWEPRASMPAPRGAGAGVVVGGLVYVVGGLDPEGLAEEVGIYDPVADAWSSGAPIPTPREHLAAVAHAGRVIALAGRRQSGGGLENLAVVERYLPAEDRWEPVAPMIVARGGHAATVLGGHVLVFGGEEFDGLTEDGVIAEVEAWDPANDAWRLLVPMTTPRHGYAAATVGCAAILPAGAIHNAFGASDVVDAFSFE